MLQFKGSNIFLSHRVALTTMCQSAGLGAPAATSEHQQKDLKVTSSSDYSHHSAKDFGRMHVTPQPTSLLSACSKWRGHLEMETPVMLQTRLCCAMNWSVSGPDKSLTCSSATLASKRQYKSLKRFKESLESGWGQRRGLFWIWQSKQNQHYICVCSLFSPGIYLWPMQG